MLKDAGISDVRWISLPTVRDARGALTAVESGIDLPFSVARVFYVHSVVSDRGGHAHRTTRQVAVAVNGRLRMVLSDGKQSMELTLDDPATGVYIPPMVFVRMQEFSPGAVCLVFASDHYEPSRSLRSWEAFLAEVQSNHVATDGVEHA